MENFRRLLFLIFLFATSTIIGQNPPAPRVQFFPPNIFQFDFLPNSFQLYQKANCPPPPTQTCPPPWCWGFWVFGDGEYAPYSLRPYWQGSDYPVPSIYPSPQPEATHIYPYYGTNTSCDVYCYIMSRKTEDPPPVTNPASPPRVACPVSTVNVGLGSPSFSQKKIIPAGRRIYVEHSH